MDSRSPPPCRRARLLSALKLSEKPKDLGITRKNFARAKAYELAHPIPYVKPTIDQCDPLLIALARSTNTSTSYRYACQRSSKVPVRDPAGYPVNRNFSQTVIYTFDNVKEKPEVSECGGEEDVYPASEHRIENEIEKTPETTDYPQLAMPEFPSPLLQSECDVLRWSPPTRVRVERGNELTPPSRVPSTLVTPKLTMSSTSATPNVVSTAGSYNLATPASSSTSQYSSGQRFSFTPITPKSSSKIQSTPLPKPIIQLRTIHETLLSPSDLPSPSLVKLDRPKTGPEIMAGLDFLTKFYARTNLDD